jgi:hypothetical protein
VNSLDRSKAAMPMERRWIEADRSSCAIGQLDRSSLS